MTPKQCFKKPCGAHIIALVNKNASRLDTSSRLHIRHALFIRGMCLMLKAYAFYAYAFKAYAFWMFFSSSQYHQKEVVQGKKNKYHQNPRTRPNAATSSIDRDRDRERINTYYCCQLLIVWSRGGGDAEVKEEEEDDGWKRDQVNGS